MHRHTRWNAALCEMARKLKLMKNHGLKQTGQDHVTRKFLMCWQNVVLTFRLLRCEVKTDMDVGEERIEGQCPLWILTDGKNFGDRYRRAFVLMLLINYKRYVNVEVWSFFVAEFSPGCCLLTRMEHLLSNSENWMC